MKTTTEKRPLECVMTQEEILHEAHVLSQAINRQTEEEGAKPGVDEESVL